MNTETYIALLRGINVSGQKKIPMNELKTLMTGLGFMNVLTYIQSGNIVFNAKVENKQTLVAMIENALCAVFGFEVSVIIRTLTEFKSIFEQCPFIQENGFLEEATYFVFLSDGRAESGIHLPVDGSYLPDRFVAIENEVFVYCPGGYGNTKLNNNYFERKFKTVATTRNLNTVKQLIQIGNNAGKPQYNELNTQTSTKM
jgi:uncharacterized protein (DUF1697 family)